MAGVLAFCSNHYITKFTPDQLRELLPPADSPERPIITANYESHALRDRLGDEVIRDVVARYGAGESATSIAKIHKVSTSALLRLLRENNVVVREPGVSDELKATLAREYEEGASVGVLEKRHKLSHGAVLRALHGAGVKMRGRGRPTVR